MAKSKQSNPQQDILEKFRKEHEDYIEELKNKGLFNKKLGEALEDLEGLYKWLFQQTHGCSWEKMERDPLLVQVRKEFWEVIKKVYHLGPIDPATGQRLRYPLAVRRIDTYREHGFREGLRTRNSRALEKGIKKPMFCPDKDDPRFQTEEDEVALYNCVADLCEENPDYSRYKIYGEVKKKGLYKKRHPSFYKWFSDNYSLETIAFDVFPLEIQIQGLSREEIIEKVKQALRQAIVDKGKQLDLQPKRRPEKKKPKRALS